MLNGEAAKQFDTAKTASLLCRVKPGRYYVHEELEVRA